MVVKANVANVSFTGGSKTGKQRGSMWSLIATIKTFYIFYSIIIAEEALEWRHCPAEWTKQKDLITHQQPASAEAPLWCEMEAATVTILMLFDHRNLVCGLLRATPVPPTKHLHKKEFNWTIALCLFPSLNSTDANQTAAAATRSCRSRLCFPHQVHWHLQMAPPTLHLYPKSSITIWSFNLLPRERSASGLNMWTLNKACSALIQSLSSTILARASQTTAAQDYVRLSWVGHHDCVQVATSGLLY